MQIKTKVDVGGSYKFFKKTSTGDLIPLLNGAVSHNKVPNVFLNLLGTELGNLVNAGSGNTDNINWFGISCAVGTGSTTPAPEDTALVSEVARTSNKTSASSLATYDSETGLVRLRHQVSYEFPLGGVIGNISEVALFTLYSTFYLQSRALVQDEFGDPTTQTLTSEDQLVVIGTFDWVFPRTQVFPFSLIVDGVPTDFEMEATLCGISSTSDSSNNGYLRCLGSLRTAGSLTLGRVTKDYWTTSTFHTASPVFGSTFETFDPVGLAPLNPAYGAKTRFRLELSVGNFAEGIAGISMNCKDNASVSANGNLWQLKFTPRIPKTAEDLLEIEFITTFASAT